MEALAEAEVLEAEAPQEAGKKNRYFDVINYRTITIETGFFIKFEKSPFFLKTLVVFAHPYLEYSYSNRLLINFYERHQHYDFLDLYETYPDFHIAAFKERKRLAGYDRFVFHFPIIWFGMPPLLRLWIDEVFDGNWIKMGVNNPFENKPIYILATTRSKKRSFGREGKHHYTVDELISGLIVTLRAFKGEIKETFVVYEAENLTKKDIIQYKQQFIETLGD